MTLSHTGPETPAAIGPVLTATEEDAAAVTGTIAAAFADLDVCRWLCDDPPSRPAVLSGQLGITVRHAVRHGTVEYLPGYRAAAVWLPCPGPDVPGYDALLTEVTGRWAPRYRLLDEAMLAARPSPPHAYLPLLAVHPAHQGEGLGSVLLAHRHAALDATGTPAFLEAASARSRRLYLRHGYLDSGPPIVLPYRGEPLYPMWREALPPAQPPSG